MENTPALNQIFGQQLVSRILCFPVYLPFKLKGKFISKCYVILLRYYLFITYFFSEYLVFQKIEKLEYNFPSGFHSSGKSFISSLLRLKPQDRLGSNRTDSDIKNHIFFNKITWADLYQQIAPPIKQYLPPSEDSSSLDCEPIDINETVESPENNRSAIDDASGQGLPFVLPKDEYDSLLKDQSVNRKNVAHKWKDFVENELIIKMGYMEKKRGFFPRKRMFLLTGKIGHT